MVGKDIPGHRKRFSTNVLGASVTLSGAIQTTITTIGYAILSCRCGKRPMKGLSPGGYIVGAHILSTTLRHTS